MQKPSVLSPFDGSTYTPSSSTGDDRRGSRALMACSRSRIKSWASSMPTESLSSLVRVPRPSLSSVRKPRPTDAGLFASPGAAPDTGASAKHQTVKAHTAGVTLRLRSVLSVSQLRRKKAVFLSLSQYAVWIVDQKPPNWRCETILVQGFSSQFPLLIDYSTWHIVSTFFHFHSFSSRSFSQPVRHQHPPPSSSEPHTPHLPRTTRSASRSVLRGARPNGASPDEVRWQRSLLRGDRRMASAEADVSPWVFAVFCVFSAGKRDALS